MFTWSDWWEDQISYKQLELTFEGRFNFDHIKVKYVPQQKVIASKNV